MSKRKKRLKVYSLTSVLSAILFFTFLSVSWKTDKEEINFLQDTIIHSDSEVLPIESKAVLFSNYVNDLYEQADLSKASLALPVFEKALTGYFNLKSKHILNSNKNILTVVDFTKSSTKKRMWIIDLDKKKLLLNTFVAHGQGSGADMATKFSNVSESHQSSLGFYVTNQTYFGKHGLSLKLDGYDKGMNDLANNRSIVVHGATYVSESFIKQTGRLGRSFGCPAVPVELNEKIISIIKNKTCLFINGASNNYQSALLNNKTFLDSFSVNS